MSLISVHAVVLGPSNPNQTMSTMQRSLEGASYQPNVHIGFACVSLQDKPVSWCSVIPIGTGFTLSVWVRLRNTLRLFQITIVPTVHLLYSRCQVVPPLLAVRGQGFVCSVDVTCAHRKGHEPGIPGSLSQRTLPGRNSGDVIFCARTVIYTYELCFIFSFCEL